MSKVDDLMKDKEPLDLQLVGQDGNAFAIMGRFRKTARRAGWSTEEIDLVIKESQSGDYDHLLQTFVTVGGH